MLRLLTGNHNKLFHRQGIKLLKRYGYYKGVKGY